MQSNSTPTNRLPWLDIARLIAMTMVAIVHIIAVCQHEIVRIFFDLDIGQIGVAMFFAISGFFVFGSLEDGPRVWLRKRLSRILIPYWIAVSCVLLANYAVSYKPVTISLVITEYLGIAGWTHKKEMIGVHFWFISLLLLCYLVAALIRVYPRTIPLCFAATFAWLWFDPHYAGHTLAFLTGLSFAVSNKKHLTVGQLILVSLISAIFAVFIHSGFACITVASATLFSAVCKIPLKRRVLNVVTTAAGMSYHFYLVHGSVYLAIAIFFSDSIIVVAFFGTALAFLATFALLKSDDFVRAYAAAISVRVSGIPLLKTQK